MRLCHKVQMIVMSLLKLSIIDLRNQYKIRFIVSKGKEILPTSSMQQRVFLKDQKCRTLSVD